MKAKLCLGVALGWLLAALATLPVAAQCDAITGTVLIATPALTVTEGTGWELMQGTRSVAWDSYWGAFVIVASIDYYSNLDGLEAELGSQINAHWEFNGLEAQDYVLYVEVVEPEGPWSELEVDIDGESVLEIVTGTNIINRGMVYTATVNGSTLNEGLLFVRFSIDPSYLELALTGTWRVALRDPGCPWPDEDMPLPPTPTPIPTLTPFPTPTPVLMNRPLSTGFTQGFTDTYGTLSGSGALPNFAIDDSQWLFYAKKVIDMINMGNLLYVVCGILLAALVMGWAIDQVRNPR